MIGRWAWAAMAVMAAPATAQWPGDQEIPSAVVPAIAATSTTLQGFVPTGWTLVQQATGDLDRDGIADGALVLRMDDPANRIAPSWNPQSRYDTNPWLLTVALRRGNAYRAVLVNGTLIPRHVNPNADDEFEAIGIKRGTLTITLRQFLSAGGWDMGNSRYTFRWQNGGLKLIGFDRDSVRRNSGEMVETSVNYLTGRAVVRSGRIESDATRTVTKRFRKHPLTDLTELGDGLVWQPVLP